MSYIPRQFYSVLVCGVLAFAGCGDTQQSSNVQRDKPIPGSDFQYAKKNGLLERAHPYIDLRRRVATDIMMGSNSTGLISPSMRVEIEGCVKRGIHLAEQKGQTVNRELTDALADMCTSQSLPPP